MQNEEHTAIESIIQLSDEPIEQLSTIIGVFNENIDLYQKMPFIVKPLLKRDLSSLSHLNEKEWIELLNSIMKNFEKIKSTASSIKKMNESIEESTSTNDLAARARATLPTLKQIFFLNDTKFCPECGYKCQGKKSLTEHINRTHYNRREEILKAVELYGI